MFVFVTYAFGGRLTNLYETWKDASSWPWAGFRPETEVLPEVEPEKPEVPFFALNRDLRDLSVFYDLLKYCRRYKKIYKITLDPIFTIHIRYFTNFCRKITPF